MTHDIVDRMVRQANPIPDLTMLETVDASVLDLQRRTDMDTQGRVLVDDDRDPPNQRRNLLIGIAAAAAIIVGALLLLGPLTGEAPIADDPPVATTAVVTTAVVPTTVVTAAVDAVPPELDGVWTVDTGNGIVIRLVLRSNSYSIVGREEGRVSVEGDLIEFSNNGFCDGAGVYQWSVPGDTLTFTALEPLDPCSVRRGFLESRVWTR